ncbi:hypothetical protein Q3O60_07575 [Alkalimonas collagenimarina]|uniref:Secreted protein n=1 Tax=Alkalimonas collagenimarina TaxID=400390 RepID=A0ABT9GYA7_9GAMM|nr:hypothetical protein [Alkalimonas collagenimarina]MDP4536041.1 hypothetical protein [Alkalimonas collagenimarina]
MKTLCFLTMSCCLTMLFSGVVIAGQTHTTHCQLGDTVRVIQVVYPEGGELPCEVRYQREGEQSVLWQARNEAGYCEQKAADFVEKQRGWGWQCTFMPDDAARSETD